VSSTAQPLDAMTRLTSMVARRAQARPHPGVPDCTFEIEVRGADFLTLGVRNGRASASRGRYAAADCHIVLDSVLTADGLLEGSLSPMAAVLRGKARATGNTGLAMRHLKELLDG
jgi:SCP-2 sterol transfer family